jgi:hypothetical protein
LTDGYVKTHKSAFSKPRRDPEKRYDDVCGITQERIPNRTLDGWLRQDPQIRLLKIQKGREILKSAPTMCAVNTQSSSFSNPDTHNRNGNIEKSYDDFCGVVEGKQRKSQ